MRRSIMLALGIAACFGTPIAIPAAAEPLTMGIKLGPSSMDPHFRFAGETDNTLEHLYWRLIRESPTKGMEPGLAASWRLVDPLTWEFSLRPEATFSDGTAVTADDVAFSLARVPRIEGSPGSYVIFTRAIAGVDVVDPRTLRIRTREPYPFVPVDMARIFIVPKSLGEDVRTTDFNAGRTGVFSGPWKLEAFRPGEVMELVPNPHWWGERSAWTRVTIRTISNDTARTAALLSGAVRAIDEVSLTDLERLRADTRVTLSQIAGSRVMYVAMDSDRDVTPHVRDRNGAPMAVNPLKDARVRRALSHAINRTALVERVLEGAATPAANLLPDGAPGLSPSLRPVSFDPDRARILLAEAGYRDGFRLTLHATNDRYPNDDKVAQAIAQMWSRIGIQTEVALLPNAAFFPAASRQEFSVMAAQYGAADVSTMYRALVHSFDRAAGLGSANRTRHSSPEADALVRQALAEMDEEKRNALFARAAEIALDRDMTIIFGYFPSYIFAATGGLAVTAYNDGRFLAHGIRKK
jgi:peptide/nickel transport system substrate-binding protein